MKLLNKLLTFKNIRIIVQFTIFDSLIVFITVYDDFKRIN